MKKQEKTPSNQIDKMAGFYDYKELLPFTGRIGAMDAFKLPSLIGENRFFRRDHEPHTSN
jgi:hypothetical protein